MNDPTSLFDFTEYGIGVIALVFFIVCLLAAIKVMYGVIKEKDKKYDLLVEKNNERAMEDYKMKVEMTRAIEELTEAIK